MHRPFQRLFTWLARTAPLPRLVLAIGLTLSAGAAWEVHRSIEQAAQAEFDRKASYVRNEVARRFSLPLYGLRGALGTFAASERITRQEFRAYVDARNLPVEFPGVRGFGFIERTSLAQEADFLAAARADGAPWFTIKRLGAADERDRYVIKYIEPVSLNSEAIGLDVGSEPRRRAAIERAIRTGDPTLTDPIVLVQDGRRSPGFLLVVPVYRNGTDPATPAQRESALVGVVYAPIVAAELLDGASEVSSGRVQLTVHAAAPHLVTDPAVYRSDPAIGDAGPAEPGRGPDFRHRGTIDVHGSPFAVTTFSTRAFDAAVDRMTPAVLFVTGALLTGLLALTLQQAVTARRRAEAMAHRMTAELDRLAMVARHTSNAVVITDADRRITWVNDGFERVTGYRLEEVLGQSPGRLLQCERTDARVIDRMRVAFDEGRAFRGELLNRSRDGRDYWVDIEIQPLRRDNGRLTGFMAVESDITARKEAEAALAAARREADALLSTIRTHSIVSVTDADGLITEVNAAFCRISGYAADELIGQDHRLINSGEQPPAFWAAMWRTVKAGRTWRGQVCNRARDGGLYWVDSVIAPFVGVDGRIEKFISVRNDITSAKRAAQALARERERLSMIIEGTNAGTWEVDLVTGEDKINDIYAEMLGFSVKELRERMRGDFLTLVHPDDRTAVALSRQAHLDGETVDYEVEFRIQHRDGRWLWVLSRGRVGERDAQGRALNMAGIHIDISARKDSERILRRERQRLSMILEGTHVGTWEWNIETGETVFNERWAEITGYSLAELAPVNIDTWSGLCHPDDLSVSSQALQRHFDGETEFYECEARMRHKDGHWVWALDRGRLYARAADGRPRWMAGTRMDITERKLAEQALRASQALLDTTGRIANVGGWSHDLVRGELTWSDQACRLHDLPPGHRPTPEEAIGYYAPQARQTIAERIERAKREGEPWDVELPLVTAAGRHIWVRVMGMAEIRHGEAVRLYGAMQDVTHHRELQDELRRTGEVMTSIVENLPCGVSVFNADLELVASNRKYREILGFPDALFEPERPTFERFIRFNAERGEYGEGDVDVIVAGILARARAPAQPHRLERTRPDGTPVEVQGAPMPGGGFVTTYTDISDRKRVEAELARSSGLLRGAIEAIDEAFVVYDPDDRLVLCNERYKSLYSGVRDLIEPGVRFQDLVRAGAERGDYVAARGRVDEWVRERVEAHLRAEGTATQELDDGTTLRIIERRLPDGHIVGFRIDVTEMMRARRSAEEASRAKSQFLANMSHEIRTPMNAVLGMLTLLQRTELTPRQADYAAKSEGAARSLLGLLNDILDFSKAEAGKMELDPQPFHVDELLRDVSVVLSAGIGGKPVELLLDIDAGLPPVLVGDAMRLRQVLINLGGNAVKFTERGEVVVTLAVVGRNDADVRLAVAVRDSGIGIAPENHARIFSGFTQAEASTTRRFGGTGLGVAICQRLVHLMGGELKLDSALGRGSRFHFEITLPVGSDERDRGGPVGLRALIVDDNPSARELLCGMVRSLGWHAEAAADGTEALQMLQAASAPYDAVFVDWEMPGLDGWQVCERIRLDALAAGAPLLVMVTAHGRESLAQRADAEQGLLDGFLVKPVTASMLRDAVVDAKARVVGATGPGDAPGATVGPAGCTTKRGARRLAGLRLLLAEDNLNNQQVARELLEDEGAEVQVAANGRLACEAVSRAAPPFDAVLMDLQMPEMDGFSATSRIRLTLDRTALPIVAMTANAMASDREACLAAGMNDHVGKPFDLDQLVTVLQRVTGRKASAVHAPAGPLVLPPGVPEAAQAAGVDLAAAVRRMGGQLDPYKRMLRNFVRFDLPPLSKAWQALAGAEARDDARRQAHTIKGLAATLGVTDLAEHAGRVERALADPDGGPVRDLLGALGAALDTVEPRLTRLQVALERSGTRRCPSSAMQGVAADPSALRAALQELARLLGDNDMQATAAMERLRDLHATSLGSRIEPLDAAIAQLDFERATAICDELLTERSP